MIGAGIPLLPVKFRPPRRWHAGELPRPVGLPADMCADHFGEFDGIDRLHGGEVIPHPVSVPDGNPLVQPVEGFPGASGQPVGDAELGFRFPVDPLRGEGAVIDAFRRSGLLERLVGGLCRTKAASAACRP